jgi:hypothetical protein
MHDSSIALFFYVNYFSHLKLQSRISEINAQGEFQTVPDRRRRIHLEVVLVRHWVIWVLGIWRGRVWGEGWERGGQFTSNLRPRWTDPVTARRVPSK